MVTPVEVTEVDPPAEFNDAAPVPEVVATKSLLTPAVAAMLPVPDPMTTLPVDMTEAVVAADNVAAPSVDVMTTGPVDDETETPVAPWTVTALLAAVTDTTPLAD